MRNSTSIHIIVYISSPIVYILPEKPNRIKKEEKKDKEEYANRKKDPAAEEVEGKLRVKITESKMTPQMKYKHPKTASQEIGWMNSDVCDVYIRSLIVHFKTTI